MSNGLKIDVIPDEIANKVEVTENNSPTKFLQDQGGAVEITPNGVKSLGPQQVNSSDFKSNQEGDIMSTATTKWGTPTSEITDDTIVTVRGIPMEVSSAIKMGLVKKDAQGNYSDSGLTPEQVVKPPEQPKVETTDILTRDTEGKGSEYRSAIEAHLGKDSAYNVVNSVIQNMVGERLDGIKVPLETQIDGAVKAVVRETGADPSTAREMTLEIYNGLLNGASSWINSNVDGIDGYECIKWAQKNLSGDLKANYLRQIYLGNTDSIRELVDRYRKGNRSS